MNNPRFTKTNSFFTTVHFNIPWDNQIPSEFTTFLDHDLFIDLHLIGNCSISKIKNTNRSVTFIIKGEFKINNIHIIRDSFRYVYEIEIPLCLYSQKHLFYANCANIMHKHKCIIYVQITNKIKFFIGGRSKDVNNCRLEILKEIEDFLGNKSEIIKGEYDLVRLIKEERKRVFVGSFIDSNRMVISHGGDDCGDSKGRYLNPTLNHNPLNPTLNPLTHNSLTHNHHFLEMIHLDPLKYTWILLYKRYELDNILIKFSTYLNVIESSPKITKLMFMSLSKIKFKECPDFF
ncbi:hypothetical protein NBO_44g0010 [Nosema bombycis CQ1]|uniref:Uncharacterized protein n=1 Tax=Nosema bombycis (strain CQ1 / CVCC 102059) TaxID=578461 RepID=R0KUV1_NOSB1|nr:hypothetical protein NBO_44g0010 [Nosema bombycis CQ1]|eukprot:EOB13992.1 hypothetical protein NBO_44g0010 [Nosema bombycis CQ1]